VALPIVTVLALAPLPRLTAPVVPESRVRAEVVVELMVPAPAKVRAVALVAMVSKEATPVKAPPVVTFKPPLLVKAKLPVELPTTTLPVLVVARLRAPVPLGAMVRAALAEGVLMVAALPLPSDSVVPLTVKLEASVPAPAAVTVKLVAEIKLVPKVPLNVRPLVNVPAVWVMLRPLVVVPPVPLILTSRPLVSVPLVWVLLMATLLVVAWDWLKIAAVAAVPEVALTVRPTTEAAVGVTVF